MSRRKTILYEDYKCAEHLPPNEHENDNSLMQTPLCVAKKCYGYCNRGECPSLDQQSFVIEKLIHLLNFEDVKQKLLCSIRPKFTYESDEEEEDFLRNHAHNIISMVQLLELYEEIFKEYLRMKTPFILRSQLQLQQATPIASQMEAAINKLRTSNKRRRRPDDRAKGNRAQRERTARRKNQRLYEQSLRGKGKA